MMLRLRRLLMPFITPSVTRFLYLRFDFSCHYGSISFIIFFTPRFHAYALMSR